MKHEVTRRGFLKTAALWVGSLAIFGFSVRKNAVAAPQAKTPPALPAGQKEVPATDPVASAIGYKGNIKDIDYKKYPQRKKPEAKNQLCKTCSLYTPSNDGWGKCSMITGGLVAADGWCASWNKKS
jgi:hypothetical protein